ncbi:tyrosine-type recombinase/integrase [Citrobacter portucalensis]|uniref:tyrosine-type recombinase/integrase n=1 Tax=Citrobacter portucalensis TaxID=1639133 RepID=UPI003BF4B7E8
MLKLLLTFASPGVREGGLSVRLRNAHPAMPNLARQGRVPSTVIKQMAVLSEMLKLANRSQFILRAPYEGVSRLKLSKNDPDLFLLHEYQALIAALPRSQALIIFVAVHTGMRPGEICTLAWEDIDLIKSEIHISRGHMGEVA